MRQSPRVCLDGSLTVLNIEFKGVFVVVACLVCSQAPTCTRSEEPTAMISDGLRLLPSTSRTLSKLKLVLTPLHGCA